jgi:preprotein translocase subunit Sec61beta
MRVMAAKDKLKTPSGMAGLVRYEEDTESKIKLEPRTVIFVSVAILIIEILLFAFFPI